MNSWLADGILRTICRLNGTRPYKWVDFFEVSQWWEPGQMADWQSSQLSALLQHALSTTPYYRDLRTAAPGPSDASSQDLLAEFPPVSKNQIRGEFQAFQSEAFSGGRIQAISTSGSTGKPLKVRVDNEGFGRYFAAKFRALRWYGVNFADRQLRVWGLAMAHHKKTYWKIRDILQNRLRLSSFDLSDDTLERFWPRLQRFRPDYINGYTSAVQRLADFLETTGKDGRSLGVKAVLPTAEMLYDWQREQMARVFGCPIVNEYGGSEIQAIAYECPSGTLHISHENMLVEVLDEYGDPVADGEEGLLTATSLCARAMPLIRYQNGDLVVKESAVVCPCGRHPGLPTLKRIVGRSTDLLLRADGQPTHWTTVYYAIKDAFEPGMVIEHQVRQKALDHLQVNVVRGPIYSDAAMERFLARLRDVLGASVHFELVFVDEIQRSVSGKHRYFVSEIPSARFDDRTST
jgi:phenylacetate-CoA ligase